MSSLTQVLPHPSQSRSGPPGVQTTTTSSSSAQARLLKPTTLPIPLLSSASAKRYSYAYTFLVPVYYYLRSSALVADPFSTMVTDMLVIGLAQALFCAVCLPSAGSWVSGTMTTTGGRIALNQGGTAVKSPKTTIKSGATGTAVGSMRKKLGGPSSGRDGAPALFSLILTIILPPLPLALMALVLGAPLYPTSLLPHTLLLAMHVSLLGFLPIFYTHGVSSSAWRDVAAAWLPFDESGVWAGTVGAMVGGWIGAVPMALDWDRAWQKWPCTVVWGVVAGWTVGRLLTGMPLRVGVGRRINLSEREEKEMDETVTVTATEHKHEQEQEAQHGEKKND
ncbi:Glycosylphosphatidylinositol (GPI) anchor assembly protein [Exophiala xenobiotica]|nr:Glycosylphosphatidylinositol (GPI) anchor assembly protein [Exophiala xenobiotica]